MKQPTPLRSADPDAARLFDALDGDGPSAAAFDRALSLAGQQRGSVASPTRAGSLMTAGLVGLFAIAGALGGGWAMQREATPSSPVPAAAAATEEAPSATTPVVASSEAAPVRVEDLPTAAPVGSVRVAPTERASPSTLHEELANVEAAPATLATSKSDDCLRSLDDYERRFRGGLFAQEVTVMRVEALFGKGEEARARTLGEAFLAKNPGSPYASRIRSVLAANL